MREVIIASDEESGRIHRETCHSAEEDCRLAGGDILGSVMGLSQEVERLHIVATWPDVIRLAAWKTEPKMGDLLVLLKSVGLRADELLPFANADTGDLFPWLYYGKRFDTLRRLCRIAKKNAEDHVRKKDVRVYCHLISEDVHRIVASSL
ncbi:MAG TPA: hypothetical protein VEI96_07245 [Thermodesulfovibrionales bacterium]|nr:hypothetical protein [Thermodesulfovibrionales bacterium]